MADIDLSAEQITVIPTKTMGITKGIHWTRDQQISMIELGYDYRAADDAYLGSSQVLLSDSSMPPAAWETAKTLVQDPTKSAEDLVIIMAGTDWGRELIARKWRLRDIVVVEGK